MTDMTYVTGTDHGKKPYVIDIEQETLDNTNYRTTLWTGAHMQLTVMEIQPGDDIGLEVHPDVDQFIRIEDGKGTCLMGPAEDNLDFKREVEDDDAILVPAGYWHNVVNTGKKPLKLYTLYGPADHVAGTVHPTHEDAEKDPNEDHDH